MDNRTIKLLLAGDTMLGRGVNQVIQREGPHYPLAPIKSITTTADLFFANLECAISPHDRRFSGAPKAFYFRGEPIVVETLKDVGADFVSLANNHALDADVQGLEDTVRILDENGIVHAGAGQDNQSATEPAILKKKEMSLGVLAFCDHQSDFTAGPDQPGIRYLDVADRDARAAVCNEVESLAPEVDHVIVSAHWQPNWVPRVPGIYRNLAKELIRAGASVVWGHSPHHFQGVEWIDNRVVIYSSGGLVDDYAIDSTYRNDRQLLFLTQLGAEGVERVYALPIQLDFARTRMAHNEARDWIVERFGEMCAEVGSQVNEKDDWLEVVPV